MGKKNKELIKSRQQHQSLALLLKRQGIRGLDPNSYEGMYVDKLLTMYSGGLNTNLPAAYVEALVELMVSAIIGQRSAFEFIISQKAPSAAVTEEGRAQRQAWQMAIASWRTFSDTILKVTKELRPVSEKPAGDINVQQMYEAMIEADQKKRANQNQGIGNSRPDDTPLVPEGLKQVLLDTRRGEIQDAEFEEVGG